MLKAVLLDLDDTLLANDMATFIPAYLHALSAAVGHLVPPGNLLIELMRATEAMDANVGTGPTNEEAFDAVFYPSVGIPKATLKPIFEQFYAEGFPLLSRYTQRIPAARSFVEFAFRRRWQVVIATNPVFPSTAVAQRLEWAGVPVAEFPYSLVTTYEDMHATKAHPAYYREIISRLNRKPEECLMIGDDWQRDMVPAAGVGIPVFWIFRAEKSFKTADVPDTSSVPNRLMFGIGNLERLRSKLSESDPDPSLT